MSWNACDLFFFDSVRSVLLDLSPEVRSLRVALLCEVVMECEVGHDSIKYVSGII